MGALVGIAKLAADSRLLEAKREVEYREIDSRSYIARCDSDRMPFQWMINPYRGCEFACKYCYARYTHEFMELRDAGSFPGESFERRIFAKRFNPHRFREELGRVPLGETIAIGTATDPYQPAERRYGVTRAMLEVLATTSGHRLGIVTKSNLVARDVDLFREIARRHYLTVAMTITTADPELARSLEPKAPHPSLRLQAVATLAAAGVRTAVSCSPVLPLINDSAANLDGLARAAKDAGALGFHAGIVFLKDCARAVFFPYLRAEFPTLERRYRERFERGAYLKGSYVDTIRARVDAIRARHGIEADAPRPVPELWPSDRQLALFG